MSHNSAQKNVCFSNIWLKRAWLFLPTEFSAHGCKFLQSRIAWISLSLQEMRNYIILEISFGIQGPCTGQIQDTYPSLTTTLSWYETPKATANPACSPAIPFSEMEMTWPKGKKHEICEQTHLNLIPLSHWLSPWRTAMTIFKSYCFSLVLVSSESTVDQALLPWSFSPSCWNFLF